MQARQLEDLLSFIKKMPPFKRLPRDKLTSIAIFCQPKVLEKGSILASEGDSVNELFMVRSLLLFCILVSCSSNIVFVRNLSHSPLLVSRNLCWFETSPNVFWAIYVNVSNS